MHCIMFCDVLRRGGKGRGEVEENCACALRYVPVGLFVGETTINQQEKQDNRWIDFFNKMNRCESLIGLL